MVDSQYHDFLMSLPYEVDITDECYLIQYHPIITLSVYLKDSIIVQIELEPDDLNLNPQILTMITKTIKRDFHLIKKKCITFKYINTRYIEYNVSLKKIEELKKVIEFFDRIVIISELSGGK